jgi:hypothetical protein
MSKANRPSTFSRVWFPISLVILLLIAIPGGILFLLNLLGLETRVNQFLESRFQLSYHIPIPSWGAFVLFLAPLLLILLYFLKLKRKPMTVPSTFLWKKSIEDLHVNALFQWLRNNVLLLLQLLVLLALIYAILAPRLHGAGGTGKHYILMIDNSASMAATDGGMSRLERAKAEAIKEIDSASDNDSGMLIVFNSHAEIRQSYTNDRSLLRQRVHAIEQTQRITNIEEALQLADSLANPKTSTENEAVRPADSEPGKERTYATPVGVEAEVYLYSDGRFADVPEFVMGNLKLNYLSIGEPNAAGRNNVAIVEFNAVRDESDTSTVQVFARVLNYSNREINTQLEVDLYKNGRFFKPFRHPVRISPHGPRSSDSANSVLADAPGERNVSFAVSDLDDQTEVTMHARLINVGDAFPLDDEAFLVVGLVRKARVLIVSDGNRILSAFFDDEATKSVADVSWLAAADFAKDSDYQNKFVEPGRNGSYDLIIFDRCMPRGEDDMPRANTYFIGRPPPPWKFDPDKKAEKLFVKGWISQHAAMRYLTGLHEIGAGVVYRVDDLPPRTPRLLEAENNIALIFALTRNAYSDVVQMFPLIDDKGAWNTNWPLQPSFPIYWRNILYSLGNVSDAATEERLQPGQPKRLRPGGAIDSVTVHTPGRQSSKTLERLKSRTDFDYQDTEAVGVYTADWKGGGRSFAVNLLDSDESNLSPRESIQIGQQTLAAGESRRQSRELWKWFVGLGLLLLLLEWYIYNKRVYV